MILDIVIAVRGGGKSRLAGLLGDETRDRLIEAMLADMLERLGGWPLHVVTPTPRLAAVARGGGASLIVDPGLGLNAAFEAGRRAVPGAMLALPGDLPLTGPEDVEQMLARLAPDRAVMVPAGDGGTGAVLLPPASPFTFAFGPESLAEHRAQGAETICAPGLALDLDTPADLDAFLAQASPGRTMELLTSMPIRQ